MLKALQESNICSHGFQVEVSWKFKTVETFSLAGPLSLTLALEVRSRLKYLGLNKLCSRRFDKALETLHRKLSRIR